MRMGCVKKHRHIREYLVLRASPMKKNLKKRTELLLKVKIKTIYNAIVVYLHVITFVTTH